MKYQIDITGMHCKGCSSLIQMSLEEEGFKNSVVDIKSKTAVFESGISNKSAIKETLDKVFSGLPGYTYENLIILN